MAEKKPTKKPAVKKLSGDAKNIIEGKLLDASDEPKPKKPKVNKDKDPVNKSFANFEEDVANPLKKMQSRPSVNKSTPTGVPQLRQPWEGPDKELYRGQFFAPEPLMTPRNMLPGRRPEALGLPPIPQGNALPLGNPESVFGAIPAPTNSMKPPSRPPVSLPDERISQPPQPRMSASEPPPAPPMPPSGGQGPGFLDKFRGAVAPAAAGAANWDPAYNPENDVSTWAKDDAASRFEERRAGNAAKEDWYRGQNPLQIKANLEQAATQQGDPNMHNIDPVEFWRSLQGRK